MNLQIRGQHNKIVRCKDYNPYLLVKTCCIKLEAYFDKQEQFAWRENQIRIPNIIIPTTDSMQTDGQAYEANATR